MSREQAQDRLRALVAELMQIPVTEGLDPIVAEAQALQRAIDAFHMEGIRFRMFNVDRLLHALPAASTETARGLFAEVRVALEAAGFHTRSH